MRLRRLMIFVIIALVAGAHSLASPVATQRKPLQQKSDPISGEWDASFALKDSTSSFTLTLKLKLDGNKVSGTFESDHIGTGKISNGSWVANKLSVTIDTNHGPMALTGKLEKGKLVGPFEAGQIQGQWEAIKKK